MSGNSNLQSQIEILKALGHKSRTFLNGITGPVQIIRSLSDEPRLIEPLRILELSVSRFDKYSYRAFLLSDLLKDNRVINSKTFDFIDVFRYMILDLTDLLDFYNIKIELKNDKTPLEISNDYDLLSHCMMILFEHAISLCNEGSTISVEFSKSNNQVECTFLCSDNGFVNKILNPIFNTIDHPSDIELYLLKFGSEVLKTKYSFSLSSSNQSIIKLALP